MSILLLGSFITFSLPAEEFFADHLVQSPEKWNIEFDRSDSYETWIAKDSKTAKSLLLKFLSKNRLPSYRRLEHIAYSLMIVCAFSLVGLVRETRFKKERSKNGF
jgi:hypothetical protein